MFVVGISFLANNILVNTTDKISEKVDITVYFVKGTTEEQIFDFRENLEDRNGVKEVIYVSQEGALQEYKDRHENNPRVIGGVDILDENPFRARLNIRTDAPEYLEGIAEFLQREDTFSDNPTIIIDKIDYFQNETIINRLRSIVETVNFFSTVFILMLSVISFLIIFITIRLTIFINRDEIEVMHLIGASMWYVRGPFVISGIIYGLLGSLIAFLLLVPFTIWLGPITERFFGEGQSLFEHYSASFFTMLLILAAIGMFIGGLSSYLSALRYLK